MALKIPLQKHGRERCWAELTFAKTSGIVTKDVSVNYWPILSHVTSNHFAYIIPVYPSDTDASKLRSRPTSRFFRAFFMRQSFVRKALMTAMIITQIFPFFVLLISSIKVPRFDATWNSLEVIVLMESPLESRGLVYCCTWEFLTLLVLIAGNPNAVLALSQ